jgi:hypothetical protein
MPLYVPNKLHMRHRDSGIEAGDRGVSELSTPELIEYLRTSVKTIEETIPALVNGLRRLEERSTEVIVQMIRPY